MMPAVRKVTLTSLLALVASCALAQSPLFNKPGGLDRRTVRTLQCMSGVAVSVGADTSEHIVMQCTVPAGMLGPNGAIYAEAFFTAGGATSTKNLRIRYDATCTTTGTAFYATTIASGTVNLPYGAVIQNNNATNAQSGGINSAGSAWGQGSAGAITSAIENGTASSCVTITGQKANASDTLTFQRGAVYTQYAP